MVKEQQAYLWRVRGKLFVMTKKMAKESSMSVNGFITEAIKEKLEKIESEKRNKTK